ncbi:MAG: prepilin peptidase [Gammaproteobacteria bacterium]
MSFVAVVAVLGLMIGSFLNVVIHRLPIMLQREWERECAEVLHEESHNEDDKPFNLITPRSRCPHCEHAITAWENIPLLSYLLQRGKCTACGAAISARYPLVELLTAVLSVAVAVHFGYRWETGAALLLTWALIALSVIDLETTLLPDIIVLPFLWLGLLINLNGAFTDIHSAVIGAIAGYLSLWVVYHLFRLLTGKEGMGYGDFKLLGMLGAWMGWHALPLVILLSSVVGAAVGIALIVVKRRGKDVPIPFGPYLAAAGMITLLWGNQLTRWYLNLASGPS